MCEPQARDSSPSAQQRDEDILKRCNELLSVFKRLNALRAARELPRFAGMITRLETEIRTTRRGKNNCPNISSYESHWNALRRCRAVTKMHCYISRHPGSRIDCTVCPPAGPDQSESCPTMSHQPKEDWVWVDAVVDDGAEWLRVVGTDEKRVLHEMAAAGWDWESDDDASEAEEDRRRDERWEGSDDDEAEVPLIRLTRILTRVAQSRPHVCQIPRIRIVLPRITEGKDSQIDKLLAKTRSLGVAVDCANSLFLTSPAPSVDEALASLVPDELQQLTPTVNLDTTILVALTTDMCHMRLKSQAWFSRTVTVHLEEELKSGGSLDKHLYPVLRGRKLVCSREAAEQFRKLLGEMGSKTEVQRADIMLADSAAAARPRDRHTELQELSIYPVPVDFQLPILVADEPFDLQRDLDSGALPSIVGDAVADTEVSPLNVASFYYGWANGYATITSNNEAKKRIIRELERSVVRRGRYMEGGHGPQILALSCARSLVCKGPAPHRFKDLDMEADSVDN
ncbi:hypothetical protein GQ53DRAFT_742341 [Thozetella sp. PMI_491]|nr:hypothetical protein GQ53DRAFT_742341 [Thozetella sp. PMI_491]